MRESKLSFKDAIAIAKGCHDYNGGHHDDGLCEAYHHGIQTVVNALERAALVGLSDGQIATLFRIGNANKAIIMDKA